MNRGHLLLLCMLFESVFQPLIALKKKDEDSSPLNFGITKLN